MESRMHICKHLARQRAEGKPIPHIVNHALLECMNAENRHAKLVQNMLMKRRKQQNQQNLMKKTMARAQATVHAITKARIAADASGRRVFR